MSAPAAAARVEGPPQLAVADAMTVAMARLIGDGDVVGVGLNTPLAVAAALLARATHAPDSHVLVSGAVDPDADLATCLAGPGALAGHTAGFVPHLDTMGMAESQAMTMQFLRPAQVDGAGNLNTSAVAVEGAGRRRFPGGLATGDVPSLLTRIVAYHPDHRRRSLPERVDVVTGSGAPTSAGGRASAGVVAIVTNLAWFEVGPGGAEIVALAPGAGVEEVLAATGFQASVREPVGMMSPSGEERAALQRIDPGGLRARELARRAGSPPRAPAGAAGRVGAARQEGR